MEYEDLKTAKTLFAYLKQHLFSSGKTYLFLDEIQEVKSWEKVVNSLMTDYDVDIYVTGSNSLMMSSEISTYLTGRYISFRIYPLSFAEYLIFRKKYAEVLDTHAELANYLRLGGFPAVHLQNHTPDEVYYDVALVSNEQLEGRNFEIEFHWIPIDRLKEIEVCITPSHMPLLKTNFQLELSQKFCYNDSIDSAKQKAKGDVLYDKKL